MWTSVQALVFLTDDAATAKKVLAGPMGSRSIAGPAEQIIDQISRYASDGFDEFIVPDFNLGATPNARREALDRINTDVVSRFA
jgi:alkanesulfonate monooxygenase SsuD/methylene tetrahydromethanopterin reductase-like flavin-dependent oxidoreductase (luciferase family)